MEEVSQRFPLIVQKILSHVDNLSLINFKRADRNNNEFLIKERFYWIRIIKMYNCLTRQHQYAWKKVVRKTPVETIKELAVAVHKYLPTLSRNHESFKFDPLMTGVFCGSLNLCKHVIEKTGEDEMVVPLIAAAYLGVVNVNYPLDVFKFLFEKADDKNPILKYPMMTTAYWQHIGNRTLLHDLTEQRHLEMCKLIIEKVEDKNPQDINGVTPYHIAAAVDDVKLCRILMENLIDKNPKDHYNQTPLDKAAFCGSLEVCRLLMETCVDKNNIDDGLRTPLHLAAQNGHLEVVGLFMANIVDKNIMVNNGRRTPLLSAILGGRLNVCKLLIEEYKADVNLSNSYGMTPLHLASKLGDLEIFNFLCKYLSDKNTDGKTPYEFEVSEHKWRTVSILNKWKLGNCNVGNRSTSYSVPPPKDFVTAY
jgi:ankyrin repeat protein